MKTGLATAFTFGLVFGMAVAGTLYYLYAVVIGGAI